MASARRATTHDVSAAATSDESGKQRGLVICPRGPGNTSGLRGKPLVLCDERRMRFSVDVRSDAKLAQVHAIPQHTAGASWGHSQPVGDRGDRLASLSARVERPADLVSLIV